MVWLWLHKKGRLLANILNKEAEGDICSNLLHFVFICNLSSIATQSPFHLQIQI